MNIFKRANQWKDDISVSGAKRILKRHIKGIREPDMVSVIHITGQQTVVQAEWWNGDDTILIEVDENEPRWFKEPQHVNEETLIERSEAIEIIERGFFDRVKR